MTSRWSWLLLGGPCGALLLIAATHLPSAQALVNSVLLTLAAVLAARRLRARLGATGPLLVAIFVFASVTFRAVFLARPEILLLAAVVGAFFLVSRDEEPRAAPPAELYRRREGPIALGLRWGAAGLLLGMAATLHPLHGVLVPAAATAAPERRRRLAWSALLLAAAAVPVTAVLVAGLPEADLGELASGFPGWRSEAPSGPELARAVDPQLVGWNLAYLAAGRNVGLLPYFLPLVLCLGLWRGGGGRSAVVLAVFVASLGSVVTAPWNFFAGPDAVGNQWFLPLYGALWLVPARAPGGTVSIATVAAAALFVWPSWAAPGGGPLAPDGSYRHVGGLARRYLPVETTQRSIPGGGEGEIDGLRVRSLDRTVTFGGPRGRLVLAGDGVAELLVGSVAPLDALHLRFGRRAGVHLEVLSGESGNTVLRPDGGVEFVILPSAPAARHPTWWSEESVSFYRIAFRMPGEAGVERLFSLEGRPAVKPAVTGNAG